MNENQWETSPFADCPCASFSAPSCSTFLSSQPYDEERYERVILDACLEADFAMLPSGDLTEIGEKVSRGVRRSFELELTQSYSRVLLFPEVRSSRSPSLRAFLLSAKSR